MAEDLIGANYLKIDIGGITIDWHSKIKQLRAYAIKRKHPQLADDFAQEAAFALSRGRKATFEQLFTDFLRTGYGDTRSNSGAARSRATLTAKTIDTHDFGGLPTAIARDWRMPIIDRKHFKFWDTTERCIAILRFEWGFSEAEIADCFGVTESRVCQRIKRIQGCLSERITQTQDAGTSRKGSSEMEGLLLSQTKERPQLEFRPDKEMARRESRGLEETYETGHDPWLT